MKQDYNISYNSFLGGYVGIGKETTKVLISIIVRASGAHNYSVQALLNHNAKVYIASRSQSKADAAIQELKEETGREPLFLQLDLANLASVRHAAEQFMR